MTRRCRCVGTHHTCGIQTVTSPTVYVGQGGPRGAQGVQGATGLTGAFANSYSMATASHMAAIQTNLDNGSYIEQYQLKLIKKLGYIIQKCFLEN